MNIKKYLIFILMFLIGIGRNLPYKNLYIFGLGIADLLLVLYFIISLIHDKALWNLIIRNNYPLVKIMIIFLLWNLLSTVINIPIWGVQLNDIFECLRILYLIVITLSITKLSYHYGTIVGISFVIGVAFSGFIAYLNPMNPDVLGTVQIFNPNVIGNILSFACIFLVILLYLGANKFISILLFGICFIIAIFTYSKATWLMLFISFFGLTLYFKNKYLKLKYFSKLFVLCILLTGSYLITTSNQFKNIIELGSIIIDSKITNSGFGESAAEGSSVGARYGLSYSGYYMFLHSPFWGVGVGNFEKVNDESKEALGKYYYKDDNANSLIFHLLGTIGFIGLIIFGCILYLFYKKVLLLQKYYFIPKTIIYLLLLMIAISINFQRELLTAYYFWTMFGLINGLILIKKIEIQQVNE